MTGFLDNKEDVKELVETLNFKQKIDRSLALIKEAYDKYGDSLVMANSLGKDSVCVWDLAKRVNPKIRGFIVTTRNIQSLGSTKMTKRSLVTFMRQIQIDAAIF